MLCCGTKKWRWLILWTSSNLRSVYGEDFPNFEMLDAKIASAVNKIIQTSQFNKKVSLEEQKAQKECRFVRGRQIAFMIYDYFRVTGAHDTVLDHADLFIVTLRNDNIQEFDSRCDEVLLSMSKIPSDDILDCLYKIEDTWVWSTQNRIGIVRHADLSEESWTWLSQIEDNGEKKYRARFTNYEFWVQELKLWKKRRGQESWGKTAWTKNYWRLLAMGNQQTVCERRQLQFPSRCQ